MQLEEARKVGMEVIEMLAPRCERVMIAGSVRRGKAQPKDIELVLIPAMVERRVDLFTTEQVYSLDEVVLPELVEERLVLDAEVKRDGPRYKRLIHVKTGAVVEVFAARPETWGYILALRTGPAEFMHKLVTPRWQGGAVMPFGRCVKDGWLWQSPPRPGREIPTPTEEDFFREVGLPCWSARERTLERLEQYLIQPNYEW